MLTRSRTRTTQPRSRAAVDWSNPVTRGLVFAVLPNAPLYPVVGNPGALNGVKPAATTRNRYGVALSGSGDGFYTYGSPKEVARAGTDKQSVFALATITNVTGCDGAVLGKVSAAWNLILQIKSSIQAVAFGVVDTAEVAVWGGTYQFLYPYENKPLEIAGIYDGSSADIWINGEKKVSTPKTGVFANNGDPLGVLARGSALSYLSGVDVGLVAIFDRALLPAEIASLSENPWQIFKARREVYFPVAVTAQFASPVSDAATGTWTAFPSGSLASCIDESAADDADYITTTTASTCEVALGALADPAVSAGHIVRYRISADAGGIIVRLKQGGTTIASWTHGPAPASLTTYEQTLSGAEADSITDYGALSLQFEAF